MTSWLSSYPTMNASILILWYHKRCALTLKDAYHCRSNQNVCFVLVFERFQVQSHEMIKQSRDIRVLAWNPGLNHQQVNYLRANIQSKMPLCGSYELVEHIKEKQNHHYGWKSPHFHFFCFFLPSVTVITMEDLTLVSLVLLADICSVIIRVSSGQWTTSAKLGLLASHLALISQVLRNDTNRVAI